MIEEDVIKPTARLDHGVTAASMSIYQKQTYLDSLSLGILKGAMGRPKDHTFGLPTS